MASVLATLFERSEVERYIATQRAASASRDEPAAGRRAVVLLSGGLDSRTTLAMAKDDGYRPYAMSFRYGQRHALELEAAQAIAAEAQVEEHVIVDIDLRRYAFG